MILKTTQLIILSTLIFITPVAYGSHGQSGYYAWANVIHVQPIYRHGNTRKRSGYNAHSRNSNSNTDRHSNKAQNIVLGGIIGGVVGNQIGGEHGRRALTIAGAIAGASIASELEIITLKIAPAKAITQRVITPITMALTTMILVTVNVDTLRAMTLPMSIAAGSTKHEPQDTPAGAYRFSYLISDEINVIVTASIIGK